MLLSILAPLVALSFLCSATENRVLVPDVPPTSDPKSYDNLVASKSAELWYSTGPKKAEDPTFGIIEMPKLKYLTIVLDHSAYVSAVACDGRICTFTLTDEKAFQTAVGNWASGKGPILVVSSAAKVPELEQKREGSRVYFLVSSINRHPSKSPPFTFTGEYKPMSFREIVDKDQPVTIQGGHGSLPADKPLLPSEIIGSDAKPGSARKRRGSPAHRHVESQNNNTLLPRLGGGTSGHWPLDIYPTENVKDHPWQHSYELYSWNKGNAHAGGSIEAYCVDCAFHGYVDYRATATWWPGWGITEAYITLDGRANAKMALGLIAELHAKYAPDPIRIAHWGIPGFEIPHIIEVGPYLNLYAGAEFEVHAKGALYAGLGLNWPHIHVTLDLAHQERSHSNGWQPEVTPGYAASGKLDVSAGIYTQLSLGVGITILDGWTGAHASLNDRASATVRAVFQSEHASHENLHSGHACNNGVEVSVTLANDVYFDGGIGKATVTGTLFHVGGQVYDQCVAIAL